MSRNDINFHFVRMPCKIKATVTVNEDDSYTIFVNDRHSIETQRRAALHELRHIRHGDLLSGLPADEIEASGHNEL